MSAEQSSSRRVALLGDAFVDVSVAGLTQLPAWGVDRDCSSVRMLVGGSCANTARHLGSLCAGELSVYFFAGIGDDELGRFFKSELVRERAVCDAEETLVCHSQMLTNLLIYMAQMPILLLLFALFWLFAGPIFYLRVFLPWYTRRGSNAAFARRCLLSHVVDPRGAAGSATTSRR